MKGDKARLRRAMERTASIGLILVAIGLVAPFTNLQSAEMLAVFKWIYAAGALIFTGARVVNVNDPGDSLRVKRLRRMEMWAGFAFCIAAIFWFYNDAKWAGYGLTLKVLQETILFTLVGALIQIIASWLVVAAIKKQDK